MCLTSGQLWKSRSKKKIKSTERLQSLSKSRIGGMRVKE